jgi:PAS domain-containing protein
VLAGSNLGFWDWNLSTGEVKRNAIWAEMLGYTLNDINFTTQQWSDFVHPNDREAAWASIHAVLDGRAEAHQMIYRMKTREGEYKWILDCARVIPAYFRNHRRGDIASGTGWAVFVGQRYLMPYHRL